MDIASLKVQDLKSELKARGLTISGTKSELVARLVQAMTAERQDDSVLDDDLLEDEDSMLGDEDDLDADVLDATVGNTSVTSTTAVSSSSPSKVTSGVAAVGSSSVITSSVGPSSPTKKVLVTSNQNGGDDEQKKKKLTINRNPVEPASTIPATTAEQKIAPTTKTSITAPGSDAAKAKPEAAKQVSATELAQLRQQKFGTPATSAAATAPILDEKMKKRAEKFGAISDLVNTSGKISLTTEDSIRLAKRKERFGVVESTVSGPGAGSSVTINKGKTDGGASAPAVSKSALDENKLKRAARFMLGAANSAEIEEKKKARADRFKN